MKDKVRDEIIKKLAEKYNITKYSAEEIITKFYSGVIHYMGDGNFEDGKYNRIRLTNLGLFHVPKFTNTKFYIIAKSKKMREKYTNEQYNITVQGENDKFVENNEPFYFSIDEDIDKELSVGDTVGMLYVYKPTRRKRKKEIVEAKILDAKHPFYKAAIFLEEEPSEQEPERLFVFSRKLLTKLFV